MWIRIALDLPHSADAQALFAICDQQSLSSEDPVVHSIMAPESKVLEEYMHAYRGDLLRIRHTEVLTTNDFRGNSVQ